MENRRDLRDCFDLKDCSADPVIKLLIIRRPHFQHTIRTLQ
jgi:hypothetical protein